MRSRHIAVSVTYGLAAFLAVWIVHALLLTLVANTALSDRAHLMRTIGYALWPLSFSIGGYTAGRLSRQRGYVAGVVLGSLVVVLAWGGTMLLAIMQIAPGINTTVSVMKATQNIALATIGGALADVWPNKQVR